MSLIKKRGARLETFLSKRIDIVVMADAKMKKAKKGAFKVSKLSFRGARMCSEAKKQVKAKPLDLVKFAQKWKIALLIASEFKRAKYSMKSAHERSPVYTRSVPKGTLKKLHPHFVKVEDRSRKYRPEVVEFEEFPYIDFDSPIGSCPFKVKLKDTSVGQAPKEKPRGFCECCQVSYNDLNKHLNGEQHQEFARNSQNYAGVDKLIKRFEDLKGQGPSFRLKKGDL